jgi:4-diphosphocytidyl-2-C-methyl-D-erythritol kinase
MASPLLPPPSPALWASAAGPARGVTAGCPAKVNLHLRVGPPRADGFHPLLTWMCTVGLFDRLTMRVDDPGTVADLDPAAVVPGSPPARPSPIRLTCDPPNVPADDRNLVVQAVRAWHGVLGGATRPISAVLAKRTPVGAGLGGGSSDAAFALLAAARLWGWPPTSGPAGADGGLSAADLDALSAVAARFGSDIPFFLRGPSAVCTGRGELVRPISPPAARWAVLLLPPVAMPTPDVYRRFDAMRLGRDADVEREPDWAAWAALPATNLLLRLANDLEPPAFDLRPDLATWRAAAEEVAARPVRMSGSGSSLFTLFDARGEADAAAADLATASALAGVRVEVVELAPAVPWVEEAFE